MPYVHGHHVAFSDVELFQCLLILEQSTIEVEMLGRDGNLRLTRDELL
jgi:hypothetical protein